LLGCDLHLGGKVVVHVVTLTPGFVMTTLAQGELPRDRDILHTLTLVSSKDVRAFGERSCVGCYAEIVHPVFSAPAIRSSSYTPWRY
jgi:uncharacterized protein